MPTNFKTDFEIPRPRWVTDKVVRSRGKFAGFSMFSRKANAAVGNMVLDVIAEVESLGGDRLDLINHLQRAVLALVPEYPEIHDTEPDFAIVDAINAYCDTRDWVHITRQDV